ncbi:MAG: hypothetical protein KGL35_28100 [Bradyrhizobium sp.]|nr:hypothetical protein [Pseudomonadota bacterium]MDE2472485.1 hypothetical protein [Bradyrhizobium sp.]
MTLGEKVMLRVINNGVIVQRLNAVIAECPDVPAEFVAILRSGAGIAEGEITSIQPISQTLEAFASNRPSAGTAGHSKSPPTTSPMG